MSRRVVLPLFLLMLLAGCDQLGLESATQVAEKRAAEGKAVGGACRHAGRAIEDCYTLNKRTDKASIYAGWREMDDYMRENKLSPVAPVIAPSTAGSKVAEGGDAASDEGGEKSDKAGRADVAEKGDKSEKPADGAERPVKGARPSRSGAAAHRDEKEKSAEAAHDAPAKADVAAAH